MSDVQLIITIKNDEQADKVLGVLNEGEVNGELDFPFDLQKRVRRTSPHLRGDYWPSSHGAYVCDNMAFAEQLYRKEKNQ